MQEEQGRVQAGETMDMLWHHHLIKGMHRSSLLFAAQAAPGSEAGSNAGGPAPARSSTAARRRASCGSRARRAPGCPRRSAAETSGGRLATGGCAAAAASAAAASLRAAQQRRSSSACIMPMLPLTAPGNESHSRHCKPVHKLCSGQITSSQDTTSSSVPIKQQVTSLVLPPAST